MDGSSGGALVSVVVSTYRRDDALVRALTSLAAQVWRPLEIVVVDDNADEGWNARVSEICGFVECGEGCTLKRVMNGENLGSAGARNAGILASSGELVTFLDDDDEYLENKVADQVAFMLGRGLDYSITDLDLYHGDGRPAGRRIRSYITAHDEKSLLRWHLMHHMTGTDTLMFRREYLLKIGCFPPIDVGDEFYLMAEAIRGGGRFGYLPGCGVRAYLHGSEGGLSGGESKIAGENALFDYKKRFFPQLDGRAVRHIEMRHFAILAFAELRRRRLPKALCYGARAFFAAPAGCIKLMMGNK